MTVHSQFRGTRGESGRASAGPRPAKRRITEAEVLARREHWRAQPASPERAQQLRLCRTQMVNIRNRPENRS